MGYFALISDITSSLFRPGSTQERSPGGREADTGCERSRCRATIPPVRYRKSKECIQNGPKKPRCKKSEVAEYRACGAEKRGFWANRQNREIATWGNATKNRPKNAAFIHAELDKRGISA